MSDHKISVNMLRSYCAVINESELRLDLRNNTNSLNHLAKTFFKKYFIKILVVTSGSKGATIFFNKENSKPIHCPAFGLNIVDKTGSGDSFLALFSLCISSGLEENMSLFIASLAAAESLQHLANSNSIDKNSLIKSVENLLA